jgi:CheY-like chemotaxis protein
MKVLVADDDAEVRSLLVEFLSMHRHETLEASNGLETLLQVKRHVPDAILLDLRMPRLGGIEALKRIQAFNSAIKVVVVTAETDPEVKSQALARGARAVLIKPATLADVLAALGGAPVSDAAPRSAPPVSAASAPPAPSAAHVLVVDDDEEIRDLIDEFLTSRGFRVSLAADGATAVRTLTDVTPDVILLDIEMPGLTGVDALPTIRALAPRASVIMVSGTADRAIAQRALALGAFDYVVKPIEFDYLARALDTALAMKSLESAP